MAPYKCCVGGCDSTSNTHRMFCMPMNDNLRSLWMSLLVPTNPELLGLTKNQLMTKRVCEKHFDRSQFDEAGARIRYSYPCLFTEKELIHGVPLAKDCNILDEHNYCQSRVEDDDSNNSLLMITDASQDHQYAHPSTSFAEQTELCYNALECASANLNTENREFETSQANHDSLLNKELQSAVPVVNQQRIQLNTSRQSGYARTRKYIRHCTKIASNSLAKSNAETIQNAHKFAENVSMMENFEKLNKKAKIFLLAQLRMARKHKMARRFSLEDKLFALSLMKQSPKGYKLLESIFALPTKRTLARLASKIDFECGVNKNVFDHIKVVTRSWDIKKRLCSIVFDEISLTPHLNYIANKDKIIGFVDVAGERKPKLADHALVFIVRGICSPWRQCIAYYFCEGTVSAVELIKIMYEILPMVKESGLKPLALVCDQGATFRSFYNNLKATTSRLDNHKENDATVHLAGQDLFLFHDPPHLLKSIRNNFLTKNIMFENKRASWGDIMYVYDIDSKSGHTRALPKITAQHINPKLINKMKVKTAAQVLSARTAAMLEYTDAVHKRLNSPLETMANTAAVVSFFDELFDSVNGSPGATKGKLRCAVKPNSPHIKFWREAIIKLKNLTFIDTSSKFARQAANPRHVRVPCLEGWNMTLESFLGLAKLLFSEYGVEYFYPRLINQDPLENFFGRIRAINYRNVHPDPNAFVYAFKSLVISNLLSPHSKFSNCEEDDGENLFDFNYLFMNKKDNAENTDININAPSSSTSQVQTEEPINKIISENVRVQISAYTAGYICRKLTKKINCSACANTYTTKEIQGIHAYIQHREFKRLKGNNLAYPNEKILRTYRQDSQIVHDYLNSHANKINVKKNIMYNVVNSDMSWLGCSKHKKEIIKHYYNLVIRLQIYNWCNIINKILCGKIEAKYAAKMSIMQQLALKKNQSHKRKYK